MKKFLCLLFVGLCTPLTFAQTVYHVGSATEAPTTFDRWEISAGLIGTSRTISPQRGNETFFSHQHGTSLRALYYAAPWLAFGLEGTDFRTRHTSEISRFRTRQIQALVKFTLTPNTQPAVYVLAGAGRNYHSFDYTFNWSETAHTSYLFNGIGMELRVYKTIFTAAEWDVLYHLHTRMGSFCHGNRHEQVIAGRVGIRF